MPKIPLQLSQMGLNGPWLTLLVDISADRGPWLENSRLTYYFWLRSYYDTTFRGQTEVELWMMGEGPHHMHHAKNDVSYSYLTQVRCNIQLSCVVNCIQKVPACKIAVTCSLFNRCAMRSKVLGLILWRQLEQRPLISVIWSTNMRFHRRMQKCDSSAVSNDLCHEVCVPIHSYRCANCQVAAGKATTEYRPDPVSCIFPIASQIMRITLSLNV